MTITSYGYPQGIQDGSDLSQWSLLAGHRYSVAGYSDLRVTASLTGTRRVNIASGWGGGRGVAVHSSATESLNLPEPSGSSQWFLVGLKRWVTNPDYDSEAALGTPEASPYISQFVYAAGTSSKVVPTVPQNPGTDDTQWLALCRVTSGSSTVVEVIDLRLISGETGAGFVVMSEMALGALEDLPGARVYRADTAGNHVPGFYTRVLSESGALQWRREDGPDEVLLGLAACNIPPSGWARQAPGIRMVRKGKHRSFTYSVERSGGASNVFTSNARGGLGDMDIGSIHAEDRPGSGMIVNLVGRFTDQTNGSNATYAAFAHITSGGDIRLNSMLPNIEVRPGDLFWFTGEWYRG
jgi:hypothetical protein